MTGYGSQRRVGGWVGGWVGREGGMGAWKATVPMWYQFHGLPARRARVVKQGLDRVVKRDGPSGQKGWTEWSKGMDRVVKRDGPSGQKGWTEWSNRGWAAVGRGGAEEGRGGGGVGAEGTEQMGDRVVKR